MILNIRREHTIELLLLLLIVIYIIVFSYISILKHLAYSTTAFDLGLFVQALSTTLDNGSLFETTALGVTPDGGGYSHFSVHANLILFFILPLYAIYPTPEWLLIIQSLIISLGSVPLYYLAKKELNTFPALIISATYLLYPALHWMNLFDYHPESMVPTLILFSFYYLKEEKYVRYFIFLTLSLMCKEDVSIAVIGLAAYIMYSSKSDFKKSHFLKNRKFIVSIFTLMLAIAWLFFADRLIVGLPWESNRMYLDRYYHLGETWQETIFYLIYPPNFISETVGPSKIYYFFALLFPVGFIPILSPSTLFIPILNILENVLSNSSFMYDIKYHYSFAIIPFIFISTVYGIKKISLRSKLFKLSIFILVFSSIIATVFLSPLGVIYSIPERTEHHETIDLILDMIPSNASVSTQDDIFPHLAHRNSLYLGYQPGVQFIIVDTTSPWYYSEYLGRAPISRFDDKISSLIDEGTYDIVTEKDGILLLRLIDK